MFSQVVPDTIGRYEIKSLIGTGGMGSLYLARDTNPNTKRLVVLKLLSATLDFGDLRQRFAREARSLAALTHPNIVDIYDSGEYGGSPFIVMQYVRGETLAEKIKRQAPMSMAQKLKLMVELCSGLGHAHEAGIVHRDIKPANLMVDQHGRLKILDFGIARVAESTLTMVGVPMTQINVQIGTPGYMSPEQIEGAEIDARSDLFAVGSVFYELLSHREAFPGTNTREIEHQVLRGRPAPLTSLVEELDPEIERIVARALEREANRRYQDAATLEADLERQRWRLRAADTPAPRARTTPPPPESPGRTSRDSRADAAYQRALTVYEEGAYEAARRFAIEALAEDPAHTGARAFLERLEQIVQPPTPPPVFPPLTPAAPTALRTAAHPSAPGTPAPPTVLRTAAHPSAPGTPAPPTVLRTAAHPAAPAVPKRRTELRPGTHIDEPVVPVPPPALRRARHPAAPATPAPPTVLKAAPPPSRRSLRSGIGALLPWSRSGAPWKSNRRALQAAAILLAMLCLVAIVMLFRPWAWWSGRLLTITRPVGGTVSASGINCGTVGSDCTGTFTDGQTVALNAEPDPGFALGEFTGDCAPNGRATMTAPRSCSATFVPIPEETPISAQLLTIVPPEGGTIVGTGVTCGSYGKECSAEHPEGTEIALRALPDEGYVFKGFTGDCAGTSGQTVMTAPRTCGAMFTRDRPTTAGPVEPPPPRPKRPAPSAEPRPVTPDPIPAEPAEPTPAPEEVAKEEIQKVLDEYRAAYGRLDLQALRRVFPGVSDVIGKQLKQYTSLDYTFTGQPEFIDLDAALGSGTVKVDARLAPRARVGGSLKPYERTDEFKVERRNGRWIIREFKFELK
ncbi:MAG: protein kinase [Luteitalea sp.]|nr:protein kinase [Luteitalea sp.]